MTATDIRRRAREGEKACAECEEELDAPNQTREEEIKNGVKIRKQPSLLQRGQPRPAGREGSGGDMQDLAWMLQQQQPLLSLSLLSLF